MPSSQQPDKQLTDSPLSQLTKVLPPGTLQFSASDSFIDAWSCEQEEQQQHHEPIQQEITHEWVEAKTREELENLLLAADRVIRERERDLGIAASIGKSLLENNIALRARQEKLLAQVESASDSSPPPLPPPSHHHHHQHAQQLQDITNRSEYIEARPPPSPSDQHILPFELTQSSTQPDQQRTHPNHHHQAEQQRDTPFNSAARLPYCLRPESSPRSSISSVSSNRKSSANFYLRQQPASSASPTTLHRLAQHNEYLAEQLADLQAETAESELEGRKRLRKLVKELETLRADLRQTEERNALLEEERINQLQQQDQNVGNMVDEIVGDMKRVMMEDNELKMKTPAKSTANFTTTSLTPLLEQITPTHSSLSLSPADLPDSHSSSLGSPSPTRFKISHLSRSSLSFQSSPQERALVSQLLNKIAELKEGQSAFDHEREEMKAKLSKAREEVEQLQLMVEDAESELQQVRQLGWDDRRGMIEWEGETNPQQSRQSAKTTRKASGNRMMINQSRKAKKRHWPAPEHQPGSIGSDISVPESNPASMYAHEPSSPSMRGQALSIARLNSDSDSTQVSPEKLSQYAQLGRLHISSVASFQSLNEDDGSIRLLDKSTSATPLRTLLSEIGGLSPEEEFSPEGRSPSIDVHQPHQADKKYGAIDHSRRPTYNELQRAVAEIPVRWADDDQPSSSSSSSRSMKGGSQPLTKGRKRDSNEWLYNNVSTTSSAGGYQLDSWTATSSATLGLMSTTSRPKGNMDLLLRQRRLLIQSRRREELGDGYRMREDSQSSTLSSSTTTIGRMSPSERTTTTKSEASAQMAQRRTSRRQEALRRLGIPSSTDTCSYNSEEESERGGPGRRMRKRGTAGPAGEEEEEEEEENEEDRPAQEAEWNYIDATDHDHRAQGASGTDYFPISLRARHAPGMMVGRLQAKGAGWGTFVYQWMKLVSVVGLAVGWAVWQGPRSAMEDDYPFAPHHQLPSSHDHDPDADDHGDGDPHHQTPPATQRLTIEHRPSILPRSSLANGGPQISHDHPLPDSSCARSHARSATGSDGSSAH
ncbi:hypothetical protein PCANC_15013 [Puccinia coronata f. sp. avenae]|uniref:Uncharacterized protein n=1 Tax=Puccinia coronata f. sp. avenae TaxID=200324 RepID=A0A2N5STQ2_9BASI|nr:hypothetical protein PCANC_15013 [Puccinia coronata f. sp. avenae]